MRRSRTIFHGMLIVGLILGGTACEKINENRSDYLAFPLGRSFLTGSTLDITIGDEPHTVDPESDNCGGYWLHLPKKDLDEGAQIVLSFTRKKADLYLSDEGNAQSWLDPTHYIDADDESLVSKSQELTEELTGSYEKAGALHRFVISHVRLEIYNNSFMKKASETYEMEYGTCMNFSRLFVALSRAAGIPARTVWGIIYNGGIYDHHHQWAEFRDEEGLWHPLDFNFTKYPDLNDIRYLDLIYAPEENLIIRDRAVYQQAFEDIKFHHDYPATYTGRRGFQLIENHFPDPMRVEFRYEYE